MITGGEGGEVFLRIFVIETAQGGAGGDVFQPFDGGECFFGDAARVEAVDEDGAEAGFGVEGIDALDGKHGRILGLPAAGRLKDGMFQTACSCNVKFSQFLCSILQSRLFRRMSAAWATAGST